MPLMTGIFAFMNSSLLLLYFVSRKKVKREWPNVRSVCLAMWISLLAMSLASTGVIFLMISQPWNTAGGSILIGFMVTFFEELNASLLLFALVPIIGLLGWFVGRLIGWARLS